MRSAAGTSVWIAPRPVLAYERSMSVSDSGYHSDSQIGEYTLLQDMNSDVSKAVSRSLKSVRKLLQRMPFYSAYKSLSHYPDYWYWNLRGRPRRTPHLLKQRTESLNTRASMASDNAYRDGDLLRRNGRGAEK